MARSSLEGGLSLIVYIRSQIEKKNVIAENLYVTEVAQVAIFICGVDGWNKWM